jgi:hypothetical protein
MSSFPKLAFMCPVPWTKMAGDEKERFCSRCSKTVVNLSTMTEPERQTLLAKSRPEDLCVAYYRRLKGGVVSAENPLGASEYRGLKQFGVAALSSAALSIVAGCATSSAPDKVVPQPARESSIHKSEKDDEVVLLIMGMIACPVEENGKAADEDSGSPDKADGVQIDAKKI